MERIDEYEGTATQRNLRQDFDRVEKEIKPPSRLESYKSLMDYTEYASQVSPRRSGHQSPERSVMQSVQTYDVNSYHSSQVNLNQSPNIRKSKDQKFNFDLAAAGRFSVVDIGVDSARKDEEKEQGRTSIFSFGELNEHLKLTPNKTDPQNNYKIFDFKAAHGVDLEDEEFYNNIEVKEMSSSTSRHSELIDTEMVIQKADQAATPQLKEETPKALENVIASRLEEIEQAQQIILGHQNTMKISQDTENLLDSFNEGQLDDLTHLKSVKSSHQGSFSQDNQFPYKKKISIGVSFDSDGNNEGNYHQNISPPANDLNEELDIINEKIDEEEPGSGIGFNEEEFEDGEYISPIREASVQKLNNDSNNKLFADPGSNHSSITKMRRQLAKNQVITPAGEIVFHPSPEARVFRSSGVPSGFGFQLDLNKINSPEKEIYEDKDESVQSTVQEDDENLNVEEFQQRIEQIEMSSDYQNIMALLVKHQDSLQAKNLQNDSDAEDDDLLEEVVTLFQDVKDTAQTSRNQKKNFYQFLVKAINGMGDIRKLYKLFMDTRRSLLDFEDPNAEITDDYFKTCAKFIPYLEVVRKANLNRIYLKAAKQMQLNQSMTLPLEQIAKKIDYEKICNLGIFKKVTTYPQDLLNMEMDQVYGIQEHSNDTVMKNYRQNKQRSWAKNVEEAQLYQVFQCFAEDQLFFYQQFELALLERYVDEKYQEQEQEGEAKEFGQASYFSSGQVDKQAPLTAKSKASESEEMLQIYIEEQRKIKHEQELLDKIKLKQDEEIKLMNQQIAQKFKQNLDRENNSPSDEHTSLIKRRKRNRLERRDFNKMATNTLLKLAPKEDLKDLVTIKDEIEESMSPQKLSNDQNEDSDEEMKRVEEDIEVIQNEEPQNLEQEMEYNFDGYADRGFFEGPQMVQPGNTQMHDDLVFEDHQEQGKQQQSPSNSISNFSNNYSNQSNTPIRMYDDAKSPISNNRTFEYDVQNHSLSYLEALNHTAITINSKSDNSQIQMYIDSGNTQELQSIENMPVDSQSKSDAARDLSEFNPGDENTDNSLVDFEQDYQQANNNVTDFAAKITVAKKKMTRSIFTIQEEAENEDQTVLSSRSGHFGGNHNNKPGFGKSQYLETNSSIELDVSISRVSKSPLSGAKINQTYDQIQMSGGRQRQRNMTQKSTNDQELFGGQKVSLPSSPQFKKEESGPNFLMQDLQQHFNDANDLVLKTELSEDQNSN